jgi:predicted nucleic acid-binding protein
VVLVDTSVWIDHFRKTSHRLSELLEQEEVLLHSFVIGELACGNLQNRKEIIDLLRALPVATNADDDEVLFFLEHHSVMVRGIGLIDAHLLASCHLNRSLLWTKDKRLQTVADEMEIGFS